MRCATCAIFRPTQGTSIQISNENNFNPKTIALHAIPNGGKRRFRPAFLNRSDCIWLFLIAMIQERYHLSGKSLILIGKKKESKWINVIYNAQ
jgi:hypothetical protein